MLAKAILGKKQWEADFLEPGTGLNGIKGALCVACVVSLMKTEPKSPWTVKTIARLTRTQGEEKGTIHAGKYQVSR
jgi:hypothetical protein